MREELSEDVVRSKDVDLVSEEELSGSSVEDGISSSDSGVVDDDGRFSNLCANLEGDGVDSGRVGDVALVEIDILCNKKSINTSFLRRGEGESGTYWLCTWVQPDQVRRCCS